MNIIEHITVDSEIVLAVGQATVVRDVGAAAAARKWTKALGCSCLHEVMS
jgi:hypothetical protein